MLAHMRTTVDIPDSLTKQVKQLASKRNVSFKDLVEEALRTLVANARTQPDFRLRDASFSGDGLQPNVEIDNWDQIRSLAYEEHGA
jgi:Arc/MetJ family transcription regulator